MKTMLKNNYIGPICKQNNALYHTKRSKEYEEVILRKYNVLGHRQKGAC